MLRCPGQDWHRYRPEDVFEVACPSCGEAVEFWRDDARRRCPGCGRGLPNPRFEARCAAWCRHAKECEAARHAEAPPRRTP